MSDWLARYEASLSPAARRNSDRHIRVARIQMALARHVPWMRWPVLRLVYDFWSSLMEDGIVGTCKPRWGMVTFAYLNDGMRPTVWHTWHLLTAALGSPFNGIYPSGAPRSRAEAERWEKEYEAKRNG